MSDLQPPRHISTLPNCDIAECPRHGSYTPESRHPIALQYLTRWADFVAEVG